jgi:hypothetical protein
MFDADYTPPPTLKQSNFARLIAARIRQEIPENARHDRAALSAWIDQNKAAFEEAQAYQVGSGRGVGASSRQVGCAEQIARRRRRAVPEECFRDKGLMARWIDANG